MTSGRLRIDDLLNPDIADALRHESHARNTGLHSQQSSLAPAQAWPQVWPGPPSAQHVPAGVGPVFPAQQNNLNLNHGHGHRGGAGAGQYSGSLDGELDDGVGDGGTQKLTCQRCRLSHVMCSGGDANNPCTKCAKRGWLCEFVPPGKRGRKPKNKYDDQPMNPRNPNFQQLLMAQRYADGMGGNNNDMYLIGQAAAAAAAAGAGAGAGGAPTTSSPSTNYPSNKYIFQL